MTSLHECLNKLLNTLTLLGIVLGVIAYDIEHWQVCSTASELTEVLQ